MNIAIIVAGGSGQRMGQDIPKQFLFVEDRPIIIYTLEKFEQSDRIDRIYVACIEGWQTVLEAYAKQYNIKKLRGIVSGGANRTLSIKNVMDAIAEETAPDDIILTFDANRPLVTEEMIADAIDKCMQYGASAGARKCYETMFRVDAGKDTIACSDDRDALYSGTGPDCAYYSVLQPVLEKFASSDKVYTVTEMLLQSGVDVALSVSSPTCIKLTTKEDIELMRAILKSQTYSWLK